MGWQATAVVRKQPDEHIAHGCLQPLPLDSADDPLSDHHDRVLPLKALVGPLTGLHGRSRLGIASSGGKGCVPGMWSCGAAGAITSRTNARAERRYRAGGGGACHTGREYPLGISAGSQYGWLRNRVGMENLALWYYDRPDLVREIVAYVADYVVRWTSRALRDIPELYREFHLGPMKRVLRDGLPGKAIEDEVSRTAGLIRDGSGTPASAMDRTSRLPASTSRLEDTAGGLPAFPR